MNNFHCISTTQYLHLPDTLKHVTKYSCSPDKQASFTALVALHSTIDVALVGQIKSV